MILEVGMLFILYSGTQFYLGLLTADDGIFVNILWSDETTTIDCYHSTVIENIKCQAWEIIE